MTKTALTRIRRNTRKELDYLFNRSVSYYGAEYVRFSPCWNDYQSKRRRRLIRQYYACITMLGRMERKA